MIKYRSKRNFSFGHPGKDVEFVQNKLYDSLPDGVDVTDFEAVEVATKESIKEVEVVAPAEEEVKAEEKPKSKKK